MSGPERPRADNRALLVCVSHYTREGPHEWADVLGDIAAVGQNLAALEGALREGGVFTEVESLSSPDIREFEQRLGEARDTTDGLLLVYFAGHGILDTYTGERSRLLLGLGDAEVEHGPAFPGWIHWEDKVLNRLRAGTHRPRHTVVVLDCCYAGNAAAAWGRLEPHDQRRISLLLAVQQNQRIDAGDAATPTPYTARLVEALTPGRGVPDEDVTLGVLHRHLVDGLKNARTEGGKEWVPQRCWQDTGEEVVLLPKRPGGAEPKNEPLPEPPRWQRLRPPWPRRHLVTAFLAVSTVLALLLWWIVRDRPGPYPAAACAQHPPLELRVLTDPDLSPAVGRAVDAFVASGANKDGDNCRRTGVTVYSAGSADAVEAFRTQYGEWARGSSSGFNPVGSVGPQPDVWIPASSAGARRAQDEASNQQSVLSLEFDGGRPLTRTPMVLLVPENLAEPESARAGRKLADLTAAMARKAGTAAGIRRADPRYTDAGLAATAGLYRSYTPREVETRQREPAGRSDPADGRALVCRLARGDRDTDRRTAALVAEPVLRQYRGCAGQTGVARVAEYPDDVPALDPVFVHVRWNDARLDEDARDRAVERFRSWLASEEGRKAFRDEAFRPVAASSSPSAPPPGLPADPGPAPRPLSAGEAADALTKYRQANAAGRVRFLLDSSGSMNRWWDGANGAREILQQAMSRFGPEDTYGVWGVASAGSGPPYRELLAFGTHGSSSRAAAKGDQDKAREAAGKVDGARPEMSLEADIDGALRAALDGMPHGTEDDGHPQLVVLLTDDEDNDHLDAARRDGLVKFVSDRKVPVVTVSFDSGGCLEGRLDLRVAAASGGRCLDARSDLAKELSAEVAKVAQGHA